MVMVCPCSLEQLPSLSVVERLPPLLSYEEEGGTSRSPSLHTSSHLTEQQQVSL